MSGTDTLPTAPSPTERWLKFAVVGMAVLIAIGILAVVARIIQLANRSPRVATTASPITVEQTRAFLPAGASVRQLSLSGDRLAIGFEGPAGAGAIVVDVAVGRILTRIDLAPEPPQR